MRKERSRKHRALQLGRVAVQAAVFALFVVLLFGTHFSGKDYIGDVEVLFHFDPLLALAAGIAARTILPAFVLAAITLVATLLLGRVFCGWVCPLGAVHQAFSWLFKKTKWLRPRKTVTGGLYWKYLVLAFVLVGAVFTLDVVGIFDPFSFLYRTIVTSVLPAFGQGLSLLTGFLYSLHLNGLGDKLSQAVETMTINGTFAGGFLVGGIFFGLVLLNIVRERFWCRYVCPLGALLGLASRRNVFKLKIDDEKCIKCNLCTLHCETQANPWPADKWQSSECVYCETCAAICPTAAITFPAKAGAAKLPAVDLSRRKLLLTTSAAFLAVPFFRIAPASKRAPDRLIRPPGALPEPEFLRTCVKCGECMKACPTNALQPALGQAGPEGLWTPVLTPKVGYCEYYCSLCSQVCPTGAIKELTIPEKVNVRIGTAWINKNRCIPYFLGRPCIVCEEHCPTSPKAIKFVMVETKRADGTIATQKAPVMDLNLCIGCGICENKCPVMDDPAIYVTSVGEQRSATNRLLLPDMTTSISPDIK